MHPGLNNAKRHGHRPFTITISYQYYLEYNSFSVAYLQSIMTNNPCFDSGPDPVNLVLCSAFNLVSMTTPRECFT